MCIYLFNGLPNMLTPFMSSALSVGFCFLGLALADL